jgi:hypothetical protein
VHDDGLAHAACRMYEDRKALFAAHVRNRVDNRSADDLTGWEKASGVLRFPAIQDVHREEATEPRWARRLLLRPGWRSNTRHQGKWQHDNAEGEVHGPHLGVKRALGSGTSGLHRTGKGRRKLAHGLGTRRRALSRQETLAVLMARGDD